MPHVGTRQQFAVSSVETTYGAEMTSRSLPGVVAALLAIAGPLAACSGSDDDGSGDSVTTEAPAGDSGSTDETVDESGDVAEAGDDSGGAEPEDAEIRDIVTSIREGAFDNVVEATSDNGVLIAAGLSCPAEGDPFMLIGARGLTGDDEYVADVVPELSFELRAVAQPSGTFQMQSDADPDVASYTITLATIGSGVTLELPGCAS